jgi:hypothetical protein
MSDAELARFIAHYERITRWSLEDEPADLIADIDERRAPVAWRIGKSPLRRPYRGRRDELQPLPLVGRG